MTGALAGEGRLAVRRLLRSPTFTAAAVVTLALGIGANTALFSLADAALLRPLPYPTADRLVMLWETQLGAGKARERVSAANFLDWRRESRALDGMAAWTDWGFALTGQGEPEELSSVRVSANLFHLLGATPALGRGFLPEEETAGRDRVVVLSHGFWVDRFGGDSGILGRALTLDGQPYQIVGVMPERFRFPDLGFVALWSPLAFDGSELTSRAERRFEVIGRLAPGGTASAALAELQLIARRLSAAHPATNAGWSVAAMPAAEAVAAGGRRALLLLLATVALVLLLACANVAHLFLARTADRERELAIRIALGGGRSRLLRLLLIECGVVAALGAVGGAALAVWAVPLVYAMDPGLLPQWREAAVSYRVLGFTAALLVPVLFACGVLPALHAIRRGAGPAQGGGRTSERRERGRLRRMLILAEVSLAVVLLAMAGLHLRSLVRLQQVDPGFDPEQVVAATIFPSGPRYESDERQVAFFADVLERLGAQPGVRAAGAVTTLPMNPIGIDYDLPFSADGSPPPSPAEQQEVDFRVVAGDYFRALAVPLVSGRAFDATDREDGARVAIVNRTLVERYFPGENPVGRLVWIGGRIGQATLVGVVGDVRHQSLAARPKPELYVPFRQYPHGGMTVVVRGSRDPAALARTVKDAIYGVDPTQPISDLTTLPDLLSGSVAPQRFNLALLGSFAALALVLAVVGVYGIVACAVAGRTREIGIRMALGAAGREVGRAVMGPALAPAVAGIGLGSAAGIVLGRTLQPDLYEVSPSDPVTYVLVALILLGAAAVACAIPALRASRIDPVIALRSE
ncbi:MAG TPA: ABC transporter permease [Gemmatimonadales bacterium]